MVELDFKSEVVRFAPPTVVSGITVLGLPLHEWVYALTIIYTLVGIATMIKKHWFSDTSCKESPPKKQRRRLKWTTRH